jgi:hypothetical protein
MTGRRGRNPLPFVVNASAVRPVFSITRTFGSTPNVASGNLAFAALPTGSVGQLLIAQIGFRDSPTFAMPSGWTQIVQVTTPDTSLGSRVSGLMAFKVRAASEPTPTFARTGGGYAVGAVIGYAPAFGNLAFDASSSFAQATATTALAGTAVTVAESDSLLVAVAIVAGQDDTNNSGFVAAGLSKAASPPGLAPSVASVSKTAWNQGYWNRVIFGGATGVTAMGFDVANVPAGSTGAFSGTSVVSSRALVIAASFRRTP